MRRILLPLSKNTAPALFGTERSIAVSPLASIAQENTAFIEQVGETNSIAPELIGGNNMLVANFAP